MDINYGLSSLAKETKETIKSVLPLGLDSGDLRSLIKKDHTVAAAMVRELIDKAESGDPQLRQLAENLRTEVLSHSKAEEHVLYEALKSQKKELKSFSLEGEHEHHLVEEMLEKLCKEDPVSRPLEFKAVATVTKELLDHHMREEEGDLFYMLSEQFGKEELIKLGSDFNRSRTQLKIAPIKASKKQTKKQTN